MADGDEPLYPRLGEPSDETEGRGRYGYPSDFDRRQEYPGYGYGLGSNFGNDGYQPHKNYFQKRNLGDSYGYGGGGGGSGALLDEKGGRGGGDGEEEESEGREANSLRKALLGRSWGRGGFQEQQSASDRGNPSDNSGVGVGDLPGQADDRTKARGRETHRGPSRNAGDRLGQDGGSVADGTNDSDPGRGRKASAGSTDTAAGASTAVRNGRRKGAAFKTNANRNSDANRETNDMGRNRGDAVKESKVKKSKSARKGETKSNNNRSGKATKRARKTETTSSGWASHLPHFMKRRRRRRVRRHVGPHDDSGLQRLLATGTLAPSSLPAGHPDHPHTVDVVFATYWFFPARTRALLPADQACIDRRMAEEAQRFDPKSECGLIHLRGGGGASRIKARLGSPKKKLFEFNVIFVYNTSKKTYYSKKKIVKDAVIFEIK